jgi:uncharacterized oligopeptide transporter (OPT) family protein
MDLQNKSLPEITIKGVILALILAAVLAAANAYLGLFAGMTVSATIPAAVISMGLLRFFRNNNILENNIVQTAASAGEAIAAGCIFTLPALILLGTWTTFDYKWVAIIAGFGGVLGVLFTIPLRRSFIVGSNLQFPEGIATAKVLESGQTGGAGLRQIVQTGVAGGSFKVVGDLVGLWPDKLQVSRAIGSSGSEYQHSHVPGRGLQLAGRYPHLLAFPSLAGRHDRRQLGGDDLAGPDPLHRRRRHARRRPVDRFSNAQDAAARRDQRSEGLSLGR